MKIVNAMVGGLALVAAPMLAHAADDMSYRYFQVGYVETEIDLPGSNETLDGFGTRGSIGFAENYFVFTEFNSQEFKQGGGELNLDSLIIGLGGHYALTESIDLVGRVGAVELDLEVDTPGGSFDDEESGFLVGAGLRGQAGDHVQLEFGVVYEDLGGSGGDETGVEVAARYHFNKRWALAVEYQDLGDFGTFLAGVRVSF